MRNFTQKDPFYLLGLIPRLSEMISLLKEVLCVDYRDSDSLVDVQNKIKIFLHNIDDEK